MSRIVPNGWRETNFTKTSGLGCEAKEYRPQIIVLELSVSPRHREVKNIGRLSKQVGSLGVIRLEVNNLNL